MSIDITLEGLATGSNAGTIADAMEYRTMEEGRSDVRIFQEEEADSY